MNALIQAVMFLVLLITLVVWAVIGFIFWIPMLTRATTVFSAVVAHAAFTRQDSYYARSVLEAASGFYFRGFRSAIDAIYNPQIKEQPLQLHLGLILVEVCWTMCFWFALVWIISPTTIAPLLDWLKDEFQILVTSLECSPKADPCVMRVSSAPSGKEILYERQEAQPGTDHQEAA